jgi:peptide/nickel transport system permease protein
MDIVLAFPGMLLAISIAAVLGPSIRNVVIAMAAGGWVSFARLIRGATISLRERDFISAARSLGASETRIVLRHILPNTLSLLVVQGTFALAAAILTESSLSFLGLGAPPGTPSWGSAVSDGARYLLQAPHLATFPGIAIMLAVLAFNFLGDELKDRLDETGGDRS